MAIIASIGYTPKATQEHYLIQYTHAIINRGVYANDFHLERSAVALAAYHGYTKLLKVLLIDGRCCPCEGKPHAVRAAVSNGQHESLKLLLDHPHPARKRLLYALRQESRADPGDATALWKAIQHRDVWAVQYLQEHGAKVSDYHLIGKNLRHFQSVLKVMYPSSNFNAWSKIMHWTFPATDRQTLEWIYICHAIPDSKNGSKITHTPSINDDQVMLPLEVLLHVFSFVGRFWWTSKGNNPYRPPKVGTKEEVHKHWHTERASI